MERELGKCKEMKTLLAEYGRGGSALKVNRQLVEEKKKELHHLKSNDPDIIALALISKVRLLVSQDRNLQIDFKEQCKKGKIYTSQKHQHLLNNKICKVPGTAC